LTAERAIVLLAGTGVAAHLILPRLYRAPEPATGWSYAGYPISLALSIAPVLLGVWLHFRYLLFRPAGETHELGWTYAGALLLAAVSCGLGAKLYRQFGLSLVYLFATGAALLVAAAGMLAAVGVQTWEGQAPVLMAIPLLYLAVARLLQNDVWEQPMLWLAHAATAVMLASSLVALVETAASPELVVAEAVAQAFFLKRGVVLNLSLAVFFAEASLFYGLVAAYRKQAACVYLAAAMACAAIWQLLSYARVDDIYYIVTFAVVGLTLLFAQRLLTFDRVPTGLADTAVQVANALLCLSFASGTLLTLAYLAIGETSKQYPLLGMLGVLMIVGLLAVALVSPGNWRRMYACATVAQPVLALIVLTVLSQLTAWQKLEVVAIVLGAGLLVLGHVGWYRERGEQNDLVTFSLFLGSLLVSVALISGVVSWRTMDVFHWPDELGLLAAGIVLFVTGTMFRLKSTTIAGIVQLMVYVTTLLIYLPWSQWNLAAILLMVGGGVVFLVGLLLSVFGDRLFALPQQIRERQSIFRVLTWR